MKKGEEPQPQTINIAQSDEDPCELGKFGDSETRTFTMATTDGASLTFKVLSSQNRFQMTEITLDETSFRPTQSRNSTNSYTLAPSGSLGSVFVCDYTTFS